MERTSSTNIKLKTVTDIVGIKSQKDRKHSASVRRKVIKKQLLEDNHIPEPQVIQRSNTDVQKINIKLPQTSLTSRQDEQLPNNQLIFPHQKERKKSIKQFTQIPQGLAQQKYNLNQQNNNKKRNIVDNFKKELIVRDFYQHPLKYKIVNQTLGINPERIYKLKHAELSHIQEQYQKNKGIEYLRESRQLHNVRIKTEVPQTANFKIRPKGKSELRTRTRSQKTFKGKKAIIEDLRQKQDIMGKIVYQRVKRHLKEQRVSNDFCKRVHSEEAIDRALIDFLKLKIERAQTSLRHI